MFTSFIFYNLYPLFWYKIFFFCWDFFSGLLLKCRPFYQGLLTVQKQSGYTDSLWHPSVFTWEAFELSPKHLRQSIGCWWLFSMDHIQFLGRRPRVGTWWSWGVDALSLGAFSLNLLRLLCLGLVSQLRSLSCSMEGNSCEIFRFHVILLIQSEPATLAKTEISLIPFGWWSFGFLGQPTFTFRLQPAFRPHALLVRNLSEDWEKEGITGWLQSAMASSSILLRPRRWGKKAPCHCFCPYPSSLVTSALGPNIRQILCWWALRRIPTLTPLWADWRAWGWSTLCLTGWHSPDFVQK